MNGPKFPFPNLTSNLFKKFDLTSWKEKLMALERLQTLCS
ncbi:hypothetical protein Pint_10176 [Pistacia integerrima]|uniref:Uncharacterized protein n=1 Tax=Pistacia integerrima TaxID=434235 RepID=A0ACC0XFC8_9ROSI|nr:hypothetical protein Pint_10176 [Pistacia integerrima]